MSKNEQINLILQSLRTLEDRCETFITYDKIPQIEIDLTLSKVRSLYDSLLLLNTFNKEEDTLDFDDTEENTNIEIDESVPETNNEEYEEIEEEETIVTEPPVEKNSKEEPIPVEEDDDDTLIRLDIDTSEPETTEKQADETPLTPKETEPEVKTDTKTLETQKEEVIQKTTQNDKADQLSINDRIAKNQSGNNVANKLQSKPIADINKAIGLNDKFQYIRELFGGLSDEYSKTVESLNNLSSFTEATDYIKNRFQWDFEDPTVIKFLELINRRYLK